MVGVLVVGLALSAKPTVLEAEASTCCDEKMAEAKAVSAALHRATTEVFKTDAVTEASLVMSDLIYSSPDTYVQKHEIVSSTAKGSVHTVQVRAELDTQKLKATLDEVHRLMNLMGKHKVVVAVAEVVSDPRPSAEHTPTRVFSAVLTNAMRADGWRILDLAGRITDGNAPPDEIEKAARGLGAELWVRGTVTYQRHAPGTTNNVIPERNEYGDQINFLSTVDYSIEVYDLATHTVRCSTSGTGVARTITTAKSYAQTEASISAVETPKAASTLRPLLLASLEFGATNGDEVNIELMDLTDYGQVTTLLRKIEKLPRVKEVKARGDFESGHQTLSVWFAGAPRDLAGALGQKLKLRVTTVSGATVVVSLAPAPP